jgi:Fcf2 pre-rRNA processing
MDVGTPKNNKLISEEDENLLADRDFPSAADAPPDDADVESLGDDDDDDDDGQPAAEDEQEQRESASKPSNPGAAAIESPMKDHTVSTSTTDPSIKTRPHNGKKKKQPRNELTHLIPGYTAPLALNSSSLDPYRPSGGLEAIRQQALARDHPIISGRSRTTSSLRATRPVFAAAAPSATKAWFQTMSTPVTDQVKKDLQLLKNRNYLDPKRFYKSNDPVGKFVQVGTVIEGSSEFYSSRLTRKERRTNLLDEVLADTDTSRYAQTKYKKMQQEKTAEAHKRRRFRGKGRGPQKRR